ncbi:hypothetical protein CHS0354_000867 [Potamilus streckersoni]|uniref:Link domain-containing protein n=1 Tax=Potamilus streckersoni TaxID=2493646 RepID=A0AAE0VNQ1_9BIVA|nr:hypothetical protein CHS0354_000867 [Potamilus streckersoni]
MCLCDEGHFNAVKTKFKKICSFLTLPGKLVTFDPNHLQGAKDEYLLKIGANLSGAVDMKEQLKIADEHCKQWKIDDDLLCAFRDIVTISNLILDDAVRIQEMLSFNSTRFRYYYNLYIGSWFMHPQIARLRCGDPLVPIVIHLKKLSTLTSFDELFYMKSLHDNINAKGFRQEIDRLCPVSSTDKTCRMRIWTKVADKIEKLLTYAGRDEWDNQVSKMLRNATKLYLHAAGLYIAPQLAENAAQFTLNSEVSNWIKEIAIYIFDSIQNDDIESLRRVLELLPYEIDLLCNETAEFLSSMRTSCTFISILNSLSWYLAGTNTSGNIKEISSSIDYEKFLQQRRFEQILNIGETTQNILLSVAQHLKLAVKTNFEELKNYFKTLADLDLKRTQIDIDDITSDLDKYKRSSKETSQKLDSLMNEILKAALVATIGDQIEAVLATSIAIAQSFNPMKLIFSGGTATDILEASQGLSQAMVGVARAAKLKDAFDNLIREVTRFDDKLSKNEIYLNSVSGLVKNMKVTSVSSLSSSSELKAHMNTFLENYENYEPAVTKSDLRSITAYWENLIDEACEILDSTYGIVSGITKTVLAAHRSCPNAKVEVQKLITIYEEIYDFQFELMVSLSDCVRAFASFQAANAINSDFDAVKLKYANNQDILGKMELQSLFSMISYKISILSAIKSYCDILTYTEGHVPNECIGSKTSITSLLSRTKLTCSTSLAFQNIPTKPSKPGDKAYINLEDLYSGNTVIFKIPDSRWLIEHKWIAPYQQDDKIFVQRFEIYPPVVSRTTKEVHVEVQATVRNQLTPPHGTEYVISPRIKLGFTYRDGTGGQSCRQTEIPNPYNDNCRDMPNICPVTTAIPTCSSPGNICPSIYAQWHIKLHGFENAPLTVASTDISLKVAMQLCRLSSSIETKKYSSRFSELPYTVEQHKNQKEYSSTVLRRNVICCVSNHYYDELISKCKACPVGTVDKYNGLFCANTIRFVPGPPSNIKFSFDHAEKVCIEARTTIASRKTFAKAVARGYKDCRCGWLSDRRKTSPTPKETCKENGGLSTVTCTSSNTWGVYCYN